MTIRRTGLPSPLLSAASVWYVFSSTDTARRFMARDGISIGRMRQGALGNLWLSASRRCWHPQSGATASTTAATPVTWANV